MATRDEQRALDLARGVLAARELTEAQVRAALEIAGATAFNSPADPAFVGAIITAMAQNHYTATHPHQHQPPAGVQRT